MEGIKNINKKLRISIFTALFLIGFIYSVYSQATSGQNNAVSSLESNLIIQELINSSFNGYSTAGQYFANFLSINNVPTSVWSTIIFFMTVLLFIGIYTFLFEIFIQKAGIKEKENETMRKAKIVSVLALSLFSAIAIGYAIPFLLSLYGFILLILVLIALFFFGRAIISYGKSFHYTAKSFEKELKNKVKEGKLSEKEANQIGKELEIVDKFYTEADNAFKSAEEKFQNILSNKLVIEYEEFINRLIRDYETYLNKNKNNWQKNQIEELDNFINYLKGEKDQYITQLKNELNSSNPDIRTIQYYLKGIPVRVAYLIEKDDYKSHKPLYDDNIKQQLRNILDNAYHDTLSKLKSEIETTIKDYQTAETKLKELLGLEKSLNDIESKIRQLLHIYGDKKEEISILYQLRELKENIKRMKASISIKVSFLKDLKGLLEKPL